MKEHASNKSSECCGSGPALAPVAHCECGCGCGGSGCGLCRNQGFVRPRFFPGQLLTDDDLQLLDAYVVGKNRLHNRTLFGEGVVCGLQVTCHPCGGSTITVSAGHALDCCGNDILVACPQTLDINAMIRDLRISQLGYDCGDPCLEPKRLRCPPADDDSSSEQSNGEPAQQFDRAKEKETSNASPWTPKPGTPREYCLYLHYCEEQTDPVSPYAHGEPCAPAVCEPTRVREGFRFELRCRQPDQPVDDMWTRMAKCFGDLAFARKLLDQAHSQEVGVHKARKHRALRRPIGDTKSVAAIKRGLQASNQAIEGLRQSPAREFRVDEALQEIPLAVSRLQSLETLSEEEISDPGIRSVVNLADAVAENMAYVSEAVAAKLGSASQVPGLVEDPQFAAEVAEDAAPRSRDRWRAISKAALECTTREQARRLAWLRSSLLDLVERSPHLTDCALRRDLNSLPASFDGLAEHSNEAARDSFEQVQLALASAVYRYYLDCICAAMNPPCRPCQDPGVLIACLEVQDCEVTKICNTERTFVLNGMSMRHWIPLLRELGDALETVCCELPGCVGESDLSSDDSMHGLIGAAIETAEKLVDSVAGKALAGSTRLTRNRPDVALVCDLVKRVGDGALIRFRGIAEAPLPERVDRQIARTVNEKFQDVGFDAERFSTLELDQVYIFETLANMKVEEWKVLRDLVASFDALAREE